MSHGRRRKKVNEKQILLSLASRIKNGITIQDRRKKRHTYKKCFIGSDAVQYMLNSNEVQSTSKAILIGQMLLQANIIKHVDGKLDFLDSNHMFYRFTDNHSRSSTPTNNHRHQDPSPNKSKSKFRSHRNKKRVKSKKHRRGDSYHNYDIDEHSINYDSPVISSANDDDTIHSKKTVAIKDAIPVPGKSSTTNQSFSQSNGSSSLEKSNISTDPNVINGRHSNNSDNSNYRTSSFDKNTNSKNKTSFDGEIDDDMDDDFDHSTTIESTSSTTTSDLDDISFAHHSNDDDQTFDSHHPFPTTNDDDISEHFSDDNQQTIEKQPLSFNDMRKFINPKPRKKKKRTIQYRQRHSNSSSHGSLHSLYSAEQQPIDTGIRTVKKYRTTSIDPVGNPLPTQSSPRISLNRIQTTAKYIPMKRVQSEMQIPRKQHPRKNSSEEGLLSSPYITSSPRKRNSRSIDESIVSSQSYSSTNSMRVKRKKMKSPTYGGGHMHFDALSNDVPYHIRTFYDIQKELNVIRSSTSKKKLRMKIELINTQLHTLFFSNHDTHLPNMQAFQKFFVDRMSYVSVHKDLDWHICLLKPRLHSRSHHEHIHSVISCVSNLLRKSVKKFNHRRGHITSSANTHSLGVTLYGTTSASATPVMEQTPTNADGTNGFPLPNNYRNNDFEDANNDEYSSGKKKKHRRLISFSSKKKHKKKSVTKKKRSHAMSSLSLSTNIFVPLAQKLNKVKGSAHENQEEPYPLELFHIADIDFVLVYYVKFLTKFEKIIVEFLHIYESYVELMDEIEGDTPLEIGLVGSNPRETYLESMLKAYKTLRYGRQSREHRWIKVQTDKRKSQKFGQDLIYMIKYMKSNDIERLHELMKQIPDFNTKDANIQQTALEISLQKSVQQPSFAFVARYLALKQLLNNQRLDDENVIIQALETNNPMVAEILLHLEPQLNVRNSDGNTCLDIAFNRNYRNLASYMVKLNVPEWHSQQLIRRWVQAQDTGDVVKLKSVLQRGFNVNFFQSHDQKTAIIVCAENSYRDCVEFLIQRGANLNAQDIYEKSALHYAANNLNGAIFRLLLEAKANWKLYDLDKKQPLEYVLHRIGFIPQKRPAHYKGMRSESNMEGKLALMSKSARNLDTNGSPRFHRSSGWNQDTHTTYSPSMHASQSDLKIDMEESWDGYSYLVNGGGQFIEDDGKSPTTPATDHTQQLRYEPVDVQQIVQILDVVVQAKDIPLDSRLLLLAVQRNWPHVILVLCQAKNNINVDIQESKDHITPLMLAAREGRKACLSAILQASKPDVDLPDLAERTPIMHAAYRGEAECVSRLLKAGANIDVETVDGTTLLMAACYGGLDDFAKYLLENNLESLNMTNENGFSALLFAASEGYQEVVNVLLHSNASINIVSRGKLTPLMAACSGSLHELVLYVLARISRSQMDAKDENGWTALMHAVASSAEKCAAILLKAGASVIPIGADGYSLLSIAIMGNLIWMVRHILETIRKLLISAENNGNIGRNSLRKKLVSMFNTRENMNGFSCVHEACGIGAEKCLSLLLEYNEQYFGGDLISFDIPDVNGRTPFMIACLNVQIECVQLLLNNEYIHINLQQMDTSGNSILVYAIESGDTDILTLILEHTKCKNSFSTHMINETKQDAIARGMMNMVDILHAYQ